MNAQFRITDDKVERITNLPQYGKGICSIESIIDKDTFIECYKRWIENLEVLDKIRAEIIAIDKNVKAIRSDCCCFFTADEILNILDKYKAKSEEQE